MPAEPSFLRPAPCTAPQGRGVASRQSSSAYMERRCSCLQPLRQAEMPFLNSNGCRLHHPPARFSCIRPDGMQREPSARFCRKPLEFHAFSSEAGSGPCGIAQVHKAGSHGQEFWFQKHCQRAAPHSCEHGIRLERFRPAAFGVPPLHPESLSACAGFEKRARRQAQPAPEAEACRARAGAAGQQGRQHRPLAKREQPAS